MVRILKLVVTLLGAFALVSSIMTDALASHPAALRDQARTQKKTTIGNDLEVKGVARIDKNNSVYGKLYAHGGEQVWTGLKVTSGGIKVTGGTTTDSLTVGGPLQAMQGTITNTLTAGALSAPNITGTTLTLGAGTPGAGVITASGKITGNGVDAGAGGFTTTGAVTAATLTTSGAVNAGGLTVTGTVDFSHATVNGLNVSLPPNATLQSLNLGSPSLTTSPLFISENGQTNQIGVDANGNITIRSIVVSNNITAGSGNFGTLSLGSATATGAVLTLSANGKSTTLGVDTNGNLTTGSVAAAGNVSASGTLAVAQSATVGGGLTVSGGQGVVTSNLQAPNAANTTTPGALTLTGNGITLVGATTANGTLTVSGGNDLSLAATPSNAPTAAAHIVALGNRDVAGRVSVSLSGPYASGATGTGQVVFIRPYATLPSVTITPADSDPAPGSSSAPKVYVTIQGTAGSYTGFTINYTAPAANATVGTVTIPFSYHVIGS